jgi:tetratricopeptide (TPR) repeat protein
MAPNPLRRLPAALLALTLALPGTAALADPDPGAYLAARIAAANTEYRQAAAWYTRALMADPSNPALMEGAITAHLSLGNLDAAAAVAGRMRDAGDPSQIALLALMAEQAAKGDWAALDADAQAGRSIGKLLDGLANAWTQLGLGRASEAAAAFDALAQSPGLEPFALYHKALSLAAVGDFEGAEAIFSGRAAGPFRVSRRGVLAHVQVLSQLERFDEAVKALETAFPDARDPGTLSLVAQLQARQPVPFSVARTPAEGMAETFFTIASTLATSGEADETYTLLYARAAMALRPDHGDAILLAGDLLDALGQHDLAVQTYALVPPTDPAAFAADIGRAGSLQAGGKTEAALEVLRNLARGNDGMTAVHLALGDALRREERWAEAVAAYDAAVERAGPPEASHWTLYYSRAIAHERLKQWDKAEPDFRQALALNPDQPQVLNYLGYSLIDRGEKLDEALAMIEKAVAAEPQSGYIVDSLAWGLFKLGRYAEAVEPMERAALLEPVDPVVTDHLGDIYWAVGRVMEARFQWRRALSFNPEEKEAARIRQKLEIGLDAVLAAEGAPPLAPVKAAQAD